MQVTRQAVVAGVAAAFAFLAGAQQQPDLGIKPVTLRAEPYTFDTAEQHGIKVSVVVHGLAHPFSLAFMPNGDALVTERGAKLRLVHGVASGKGAAALDPEAIAGVPEPGAFRGAGIAEIALHPKFAENQWLYFTYNKPGGEIPNSNPPGRRQAAVALGRGKLEGKKLTGVQELFVGEWENGNSGSRLAFGKDGLLYMTTGAPFDDSAQNVGNVYGKVLRMRGDGQRAERRARTERRRRGEPAAARPQLRLAEVQLRPQLRRRANFAGAARRRDRAAANPLVAVDCPDRAHLLYGRPLPDVEGQPVRRQRSRRGDSAHGRARARGRQRQARGAAPRAAAVGFAPEDSRRSTGTRRAHLRDHRRGRRRADSHRAC